MADIRHSEIRSMDQPTPKPPQRATIKDVAKRAGVSAMTVSNVLNGRVQSVSPTTRKRVERAIADLKYRRQASARNLRVTQQRSIGMVIVDESPFFLADLFTCQLVAGLTNVLNKADYTVTLQGTTGAQLGDSMIMRSYEVGGFCTMISGPPADRHAVIERLLGLDQPLIVFQEATDTAGRDLCVIRQDDRGGGRLLADHLLARRASRFLLIAPRQGWPAIEQRIAGFREGLAPEPAATVEIIESESESFGDVQAAVAAYLADNPVPDAVVGTNDAIATAAMLHLIDRGCSVPDDVRVVGFNAFQAHRYAQPRLTTVQSAPYELGQLAGQAMLQRLGTGRFETSQYLLPVAFAPGQTT
jgi:DNA-binding LacI/PurR family transcriptional regulator